MNRRICFVGLENLSVLTRRYAERGIGGEQVQQTLLAKAFARRGYDVRMVVADYGQADGEVFDGIRTFKAFAPQAGVPVLRFVHPRWTGLWSALSRADSAVYYYSCAGMQLGLGALHAGRRGARVIQRIAHDNDCDPKLVDLPLMRDRLLYEYGLRHADAILAQSGQQAAALDRNYGLPSTIAGMLAEPAARMLPFEQRDFPVLWVNTLREFKRPDRMLDLAESTPELVMHMIGGQGAGSEALYETSRNRAATLPNVVFHGQVPYHEVNDSYERSRVFVNTSDSEGFPNSYLQAWIRGTPVVAFFDPDGVIVREGLGQAVGSLDEMRAVVRRLAGDPVAWSEASARCRAYAARAFDETRILAPYLDLVERLLQKDGPA